VSRKQADGYVGFSNVLTEENGNITPRMLTRTSLLQLADNLPKLRQFHQKSFWVLGSATT
jgi:hypothetical protein